MDQGLHRPKPKRERMLHSKIQTSYTFSLDTEEIWNMF
jgi:hypothetical protein